MQSNIKTRFPVGWTVICIDESASANVLGYMKQYVVIDASDCFLTVEDVEGKRVKGEWHETRFVLSSEV